MQLSSLTPKKTASATPNGSRFQSKTDKKPNKSTQEVDKLRDIPKTGTSYDDNEH